MKRTIKTLSAISLALTSLYSCNDRFEPKAALVGDVYIKSTIYQEEIKYSLCSYAYTNFGIKDANVTNPSGNKTILKSYYHSQVISYDETFIESEYLENVPQTGKYSFNIESKEGKIISGEDILTAVAINFPEGLIVKKEDKVSGTEVNIKWKQASDADKYQIKMFDKDNKLIFRSILVDKKTNGNELEEIRSIYATENSYGWLGEERINSVAKITLAAIKLEDPKNDSSMQIEASAETSTMIEE